MIVAILTMVDVRPLRPQGQAQAWNLPSPASQMHEERTFAVQGRTAGGGGGEEAGPG